LLDMDYRVSRRIGLSDEPMPILHPQDVIVRVTHPCNSGITFGQFSRPRVPTCLLNTDKFQENEMQACTLIMKRQAR